VVVLRRSNGVTYTLEKNKVFVGNLGFVNSSLELNLKNLISTVFFAVRAAAFLQTAGAD